MASTTAVKNSMANAWAALGNTYSLHTGDPGAGGTANEASGPSYNRQNTTWGTASNGTVVGSQITFLVPAGDYTHMCRWSGSTLLGVYDTTDAHISPDGEVKVTPSHTYAGD